MNYKFIVTLRHLPTDTCRAMVCYADTRETAIRSLLDDIDQSANRDDYIVELVGKEQS